MVAKQKKKHYQLFFEIQNYPFSKLREFWEFTKLVLETNRKFGDVRNFEIQNAKKLCYLQSSRIYSFKAEMFGQNLKYEQHDRVIQKKICMHRLCTLFIHVYCKGMYLNVEHQRCRQVFKSGWASSNVVGIISPLLRVN